MTPQKKSINRFGQLIAVTGGISSGKSYVLQCFKKLGFLTYSFDLIIAKMYKRDGLAFNVLAEAFPNCVTTQGIDKKKLGEIVFKYPNKLSTLESLIHPLIRKQMELYIKKVQNKTNRSIVIEIPLLFETGYPERFDTIISTVTTPEIQKQRALERKNMTLDKFNAIISKQYSNDYRVKNSNYIIHSSCSKAHTFKQIKILVNNNGRIKRNRSGYRNYGA